MEGLRIFYPMPTHPLPHTPKIYVARQIYMNIKTIFFLLGASGSVTGDLPAMDTWLMVKQTRPRLTINNHKNLETRILVTK